MPPSKPYIASLPYFSDSSELFSAIASNPWSVFLDSGFPRCQQGRYDIIATDPVCTLVTHGNLTEIRRREGTTISKQDPFDLIKQQLTRFPQLSGDLPFHGGAIGFFSYDLARRLEQLSTLAVDKERMAEMAIGIYEWAVVVDHLEQQSFLVGRAEAEVDWHSLSQRFGALPKSQVSRSFKIVGEIHSNMDKDFYNRALARIKHYLKEGDCYQVNFSQRFNADCEGDPWVAYHLLRELNAAPFSCYINYPEAQILSSSPECFLKLTDGIVETRPIKGTRPRKDNEQEDLEQKLVLQNSSKDRAENVMIVDLLRNDIGKTCEKGSVKVPEIFTVETYATVHHLVSTITGRLAAHRHALDLLKHCFPGGSVTGAPKIRAMEIIEELEPNRRGVYCGAIGYIGYDGNMDSNIAIRTLVHSHGNVRFWAGGGIVNDSVADDEYQECFDKAAAMLNLLQRFSA